MEFNKPLAILSVFLIVAFCAYTTQATDCDEDRLKVYIKINETEWDDAEEYLLRATTAYSVRKFCAGYADTDLNPDEYNCENGLSADTSTTTACNKTARISYCVKVENVNVETVRISLKESKANLNGALILTEEEVVIEGVLPTLETPVEYSFSPWLIAYIVFTACVIFGGVLVAYYSFKKPDEKEALEEEEGLQVEENRGFVDERPSSSFDHITRM